MRTRFDFYKKAILGFKPEYREELFTWYDKCVFGNSPGDESLETYDLDLSAGPDHEIDQAALLHAQMARTHIAPVNPEQLLTEPAAPELSDPSLTALSNPSSHGMLTSADESSVAVESSAPNNPPTRSRGRGRAHGGSKAGGRGGGSGGRGRHNDVQAAESPSLIAELPVEIVQPVNARVTRSRQR
jgi:hypothetical protein